MATTTDLDTPDDLSSIAEDSGVDDESLYDEGHNASSPNAEPDAFALSTAAAQAAKALEVAQGSSAFDGPAESPVASPGWPDERSLPILDAGPAPPDYYAATTARRHPERDGVREGTDDERSSTAAEEFEVLEPLMNYDDSLAYSPASSHKRSKDIKHRLATLLDQIRHGRPPSLRFTRMAQRSALLLLLTLIIACAIVVSVPRRRNNILHPDYTRLPDEVRNPSHDHPNTEHCRFDSFSEYVEIPFDDLDYFTFEEGDLTSDDAAGLHIGGTFHDDPRDWKKALISGNVVLMETPQRADARDAAITVRINIATTEGWTTEKIRFVKHGQIVRLQTPVLSASSEAEIVSQTPCMDMWVGIYVPQRYSPVNWEVDLKYLNFHQQSPANLAASDNNFVLNVENSTRIASQYGAVHAALSAASISVETWTGKITGSYSFHDAVSLEALSGDIDVTITPLEPSNSDIRTLQTSTDTGEMKVVVPPEALDNAASIQADHFSGFGSTSLTYPVGWPANVHTTCLTGSLRINGRTIPKDEFTDDGASEVELVTEPDDESYGYLNVHSTWGDLDLIFQEVAREVTADGV